MARPRSFDTDAVLTAARDLFWSRGYQAASLDELARLTGVNKPSLYAAFGDKTTLFLRVLDGYHAEILAMSRHVLEAEGSPRRALRAWLIGFLSFCSGATGERGCLSVNTSLEASALNPEVRVSINRFQMGTIELLRAAFDRGKTQGEFAADFDSESTARVVFVAQAGLMAVARGRPTAVTTLTTMERLMDSLAPEPTSARVAMQAKVRRPRVSGATRS